MADYIAHASIDENGKVSGGKAGDQTGKEVCIRTCYSNNWHYVLRVQNQAVRTQFGNNMIDIAKNENIGYNQAKRNTLLTQALKTDFDFAAIKTPCDCDCSSGVATCLLGAIYKVLGQQAYENAYKILVNSGNCATTRTLRNQMQKVASLDLNVYEIKSKISKMDGSLYGDIYLKEGSHVVVYIGGGNKQTVSSSSISVLEWQNAAIADGFSFPKYGADGEWGSECEAVAKQAIIKIAGTPYPNLTKIVQKAIGFSGNDVDGECGSNTRAAIIIYQKNNGLAVDGCVGLNTWKTIVKN